METIKEKLLQASFLLTLCILNIRKTQTSLFPIVLSQITAHKAQREKCSCVDYALSGQQICRPKFSQLIYICFPSAVIWRQTGKR